MIFCQTQWRAVDSQTDLNSRGSRVWLAGLPPQLGNCRRLAGQSAIASYCRACVEPFVSFCFEVCSDYCMWAVKIEESQDEVPLPDPLSTPRLTRPTSESKGDLLHPQPQPAISLVLLPSSPQATIRFFLKHEPVTSCGAIAVMKLRRILEDGCHWPGLSYSRLL